MDVSSINILLYCLNRLYFSPETWKNSILTYCYTFIYKWLWKFAKQCWENWMLIGKTIFICIKWILRLADHIEYCIWTMLMFNISCCHFGTSNVFFFCNVTRSQIDACKMAQIYCSPVYELHTSQTCAIKCIWIYIIERWSQVYLYLKYPNLYQNWSTEQKIIIFMKIIAWSLYLF